MTTLNEAVPGLGGSDEHGRPVYSPTLPDGWIVKHEWYGARFECEFRNTDEPDRAYVVAVLAFEATGEMRMDGPRRAQVRRDTIENVPAWCFLYAFERVRELLDALRTMPEALADETSDAVAEGP